MAIHRSAWPLLCFLFFYVSASGQNATIEQGREEPDSAGAHRLGSNVNTAEDEIAPVRYAGKLYYSSEVKNERTGKKASRIFSVVEDEPAFQLKENPKESMLHAAHLAFNLKADGMYFTQYRKTRNGELEDCQLRYRKRNYDGTWKNSHRLPRPIILPEFVSMQPAFGYDRDRGSMVLFFVSDRPGGKGGLDIWCAEYIPGLGMAEAEYGEPFNLSLNTEKDDVSPFFDTRTQTLFFSSNGRYSYGGFDIYQSKKELNGTWLSPTNLKEPINSSEDDLYFTFHHASEHAYFSSNRLADDCASLSCQNFDIYEAAMVAELRLEIIDATNDSPLSGCNVELVNSSTQEVEVTLLKVPTAQPSVDLLIGKSYRLILSKQGYLPVFLEVQANEEEMFTLLTKKILMKKM